jgi:predicted DNA-binding transcriptional regulator YafY
MKIERLLAIIMLLLERETISTNELAKRLEVSRRTIFRDIDALCIAGMPIMVTRGAMGGVSLMKSYKVDKKLLTPKDVQSLTTSLQSYYQLLENKEIATLLTKLQSMSEENHLLDHSVNRQKFSVDLELNKGNRSLRNLLKTIETAIINNRYLLFNYIDKKGEISVRKVEPYKVVYKESKWYLQAFSIERNDYRIFKLARMSKACLTEDTFSPRDFISLQMDGSNWTMKEMVPIIIKIDRSIKDKVVERFGEENIIAQQDNNYLTKYYITDDDEGYNILLAFGKKCEIIEPISIRQKFNRYLLEVAKIYETN